MNDITPKEAIANLNHIYGMVAPDIQRSLDVAIKALERPQGEILHKIPKDFVYDTETSEFYCYRNKYTGEEIHIVKSPKTYVLARSQGEWIETQRGIHVTDYKCSCCGRTVRDDTGYDVSKDYPFCHCGADMRGGAE